jgi:hypothetical protein
LLDLEYVGVKAPQFSFTRLQGADPTLGVEMSSTGEVACFGKTIHEAYLLALKATRFKMPTKSHNVLLSIGPSRSKSEFVESAQQLVKMVRRSWLVVGGVVVVWCMLLPMLPAHLFTCSPFFFSGFVFFFLSSFFSLAGI